MRTWKVKEISPFLFHVINVDTKKVDSEHVNRWLANKRCEVLNKKTVSERIGG